MCTNPLTDGAEAISITEAQSRVAAPGCWKQARWSKRLFATRHMLNSSGSKFDHV